MTPAELKTLREACGLSLPHLAALSGVQERTARYWESGTSRIPADVSAMIAQLDAQLTLAAHQGVHVIAEQARAHPDQPLEIILIRYRTDADLHRYRTDMQALPASTHAAILYRTRAALESEGIPSRIVYMRPDDYEAWRGKRKDTEPLRAEWAAQQPLQGEQPA